MFPLNVVMMLSRVKVLFLLTIFLCSSGSNLLSFGFVVRQMNHHQHYHQPRSYQRLLQDSQLKTSNCYPSRLQFSFVPPNEESSTSAWVDRRELALYILPFITTFVAFHTYGDTSTAFHNLVEYASDNNWVPADGGKYAASIITPAVNGPLIASVAILFGTLISITVSALYERQEKIRLDLATEIETLRYLQQIIQGFPNQEQKLEAQTYVNRYTDQVFSSLDQIDITADLVLANTALGDLVSMLNKLSLMAEYPDKYKDDDDDNMIVPMSLIDRCYNSVETINAVRSSKVNSLLSNFPPTHYLLLSSLAFCICLAFLVETDQDVLFFLTGFQLKLCWGGLIGVFTSMAVLLNDLIDPFTGPYAITDFDEERMVAFQNYAKNNDKSH